MDRILKKWKAFQATAPGQLLTVILYAAMIALVLIFFTGEGEFIYEGF